MPAPSMPELCTPIRVDQAQCLVLRQFAMDSAISTTSAQKSSALFISLAVASVDKIIRASQSVIANNVLDVIYQNNSQIAFETHCKVRLALAPAETCGAM